MQSFWKHLYRHCVFSVLLDLLYEWWCFPVSSIFSCNHHSVLCSCFISFINAFQQISFWTESKSLVGVWHSVCITLTWPRVGDHRSAYAHQIELGILYKLQKQSYFVVQTLKMLRDIPFNQGEIISWDVWYSYKHVKSYHDQSCWDGYVNPAEEEWNLVSQSAIDFNSCRLATKPFWQNESLFLVCRIRARWWNHILWTAKD